MEKISFSLEGEGMRIRVKIGQPRRQILN